MRLRAEDFGAPGEGHNDVLAASYAPAQLSDLSGRRYFLHASGSPAQLRWHRESPGGGVRPLSAREVIGALEAYEPVCTLTRAAVARFRADRTVSVAALSVELRRIESSPIVLNRRLREAVRSGPRAGAKLQRDRDLLRADQA